MANSNEAKTEPEIIKTDKYPAEHHENVVKSKSSVLAVLVALIALIIALYSIYINQQTALANDNLHQQQSADSDSISTLEDKFKQSNASLQKQFQELKTIIQATAQQNASHKEDWLLLKARYYLELAQINAYWSNDQQATIALLHQADSLLATNANQQIFPVRQAIAIEISELQALPKVDIPGLLSQLDAVQNALPKLQLIQPIHEASTSETNPINNDSKPWDEQLKNSIGAIEKLVTIRHHDEDIKPLLSPLHQRLVRDSIQLNLQEAQWAILQNNPKVFQLALSQALEQIKRSFNVNTDSTKALITQLQGLQQTNLSTSKIKLEKSLTLLNQLVEQNNSQPINKPVAPQGGAKK
ncbi:MAG: uroporphyrinogen-III C-methyltransferase [Tatlockia sp.]|nr:uroporphyrinogen-III C-methyltransferase [Tatlockia sp.]